MIKNLKLLLVCIAIPLLVGGLSAFLTMDSMAAFAAIEKPPLSPPGILFPIVWTVLYVLMGVASYLVLTSGARQDDIDHAITIYAIQLVLNFFWSIIFFRLEWYLAAFLWLVLLWIAILCTLLLFRKISKAAGWLLVPYLLWVTFAGYLNLSIYLLNR